VAAGGQDPWAGNVAAPTEVMPADLEQAANCCCPGGRIVWTQTLNAIALGKKRNPNAAVSALQWQLRAERLADYVSRAVAQAPPLTPEQRDRIVALLRAGGAAA